MAAVLEKTGYIAIAGRERQRRVESLRGSLNKSAQGMRFVLAALAAEIVVSSSSVSLLESVVLVSTIVIGTIFCFSMERTSQPSHVRLYRVSLGIVFGVIAGMVLSGVMELGGIEIVGALPLASITFGGLMSAVNLGRYATSE